MKNGEKRTFELDLSKKPNCGLSGSGKAVTISITKDKTQKDPKEYKFSMSEYEYSVYIVCRAGYVPDLAAGGIAEDCGIGKILMQLCLNEKKLHKISNKNKNNAMNQIRLELQGCKIDNTCNEPNIKKIERLEVWVESKCSKILYLDMSSSPMTKAYVYFNSALASGFTDMFIRIGTRDIYPKEGPCSTQTLKERYTDEGTMVDGDDEIIVHGRAWFFCLPKLPSSNRKCTIL